MNVSGLENSINRYSKKRKSNDVIKTSSIKNGKKSLPQVFIDLNNHTKKTKLTLDQKPSRNKDQNHFTGEISNFNQGKIAERNKKIVKKDHILLKNLYNTELLNRQDQNKNILNEYRDQIELLKMDNQRLRQENLQLKYNQDYLQRRLKEEKIQKNREIDQMKSIHSSLEDRIIVYQQKIKGLYEQLIKLKKDKYSIKDQKGEFQEQIILTTLNSQNNRARTKGELRSYREQEGRYNNYEIEVEKYKRLTSPSSHSRGKGDKNISKWCEEQREYLRMHEEKGELAYYRGERYRQSGRNSMLQSMQD